jgi:hypothetical protein
MNVQRNPWQRFADQKSLIEAPFEGFDVTLTLRKTKTMTEGLLY